MRLTASRASITSSGGAVLDAIQQEDPTLDLNFEETKTLTDDVSGNNLVTFSRASSGTYVDSDGLIKSATTDAPRFDHDPVTGESLGLLIEEARTNELIFSSTLDSYGVSSIASKTQNAGIAPDGTNTAVLAETISTGIDSHLRAITAQAVNTTYTYSFFAKPGTVDYAVVYNIAKNSVGLTWFNVADGTIGTTASGVTPFIEPAGNGWYRVGVTQTTDATIANNLVDIRWALEDGVNAPTTGENIYVWGAQLEAGSFPTSYIPTSGSTVTRAADVASIEGTNFSSWYNQSEGTVFVAVDKAYKTNTIAAAFDDGSGANRIEVRSSGSSLSNARYVITDNSTTVYSKESSTAGANRLKLALAYKTGSVNNATNGVIDIVDATASIPNVSRLAFQNEFFLTDQRPGHIARLAYFPTRKTDQQLIDLTT